MKRLYNDAQTTAQSVSFTLYTQLRRGEHMDVMTIFAIQFIMSLLVWGLLAYWLLTPWLEKKSLNEAFFFLAVPHAFRHIGMVFLVPGIVAGPLPETFAAPAALGDLLTGVLALLALIALRNNWSVARVSVWLFSIVGTIAAAIFRQEHAH